MTCRVGEILFCRVLNVIVTNLIVYRKKSQRNISLIQKDILVMVLGVMEFVSRREHFLVTKLPSSIQ
jgi:hypothetical protein